MLTSRQLEEVNAPPHFKEYFVSLCSPIENEETEHCNDITGKIWDSHYEFQKICTKLPLHEIDWKNYSAMSPPSSYKIIHFDSEYLNLLLEVYKVMYPNNGIQMIHLAEIIHKFGSITSGHTNFGSNMQPRGIRSSRILASWTDGQGHILKDSFSLSAGDVNFYFSHSLKLDSIYVTHYFACARWYIPDDMSDRYGNPFKMWNKNYQLRGPSAFMPIQRIHSRCAYTELQLGNLKVVTCPILRNVYF